MYYYSNNYSKYIEDLKLEKSKIAFQRLVEDSKEDKNPDIRIKEVPLSKESDSVTKELDIPSKDGKSFSYEGVSSEKSGNKIDTESLRASEKSEDRINYENEISGKSSEQIKDASSFSNIEPNEVEYDIDYSLKNGSDINGENKLSSKGDSDISVESELNDKSGNEISIESETVSKSELDMFTENLPSSKNGADLKKQNELSSKNGRDLSGENVLSSKSTIDIIRSIKEEKKREGEFADIVDDQKKKNNFILEKSYQYFLMDPKDWEAIEYEKNAEKYDYYPADSYSQMNAVQKGAIEDIASVFGNSNSWSNGTSTVISSLKVASDLTDTIWPSVNIYKEGKTANKLRSDLKVSDKYLKGEKDNNSLYSTTHASERIIEENNKTAYFAKIKVNKTKTTSDGNSYDYGYTERTMIFDSAEERDAWVQKLKLRASRDGLNIVEENLYQETYTNSFEYNQALSLDFKREDNFWLDDEIIDNSYKKVGKDILESNEEGIYDVSVPSRKENKKDISGKVEIIANGQHPGNYEQTGDTQHHRIVDVEDFAEIKSSKNDLIEIHDGPANESGGLDTDFFEDSDLTNKDSDETRKDISNSESGGYANDESERNSGVNDKVFNFSYKNKKNINNIAVESESIGEETRWYDTDKNLKAIGRIYVTPPDYELNKNSNAENSGESDINGNKAFSIPLQNNLTFEQISRAATWNAIQFFGRIGDVQQYSKTGNLEAINITTKYFVESEDGNDTFTMAKLQDIEMMYRSLVLPASDSAKYLYQEDTDANSYYYFTRPPLLNIVLGNPGSQTNEIGTNYGRSEMISNGKNPYFNLFTDIYTVPKTNIDEEGENNFENSIYYKNFVATNVTIDKNLNDYNYYVRDKKYFDTTGFTVTLTLLEIDENYLGSLPSFNNYNYTLRSRGAI